MAIVKVISHGKNMVATRKILSYVLDAKKTSPEYCGTLGDFDSDIITPKNVYRDFQRVRELFGKESGGRTYIHGTVSWAPGEVTYEEAADFAKEYLPQIYPQHQILYATHQDTDHPHFHFVVNPVSYLDGSMAHWSKHDLEKAKELCNTMCLDRGWAIPQKGRHHDGTAFADGEITAWDKNKYHEIINNPKKSYLVDAILAIQGCMTQATGKDEFCSMMEHEYGWRVVWEEKKKHITFIDANGHKVRGSNLSKTFNMDISKEAIQNECKRNNRRKAEKAHISGIARDCSDSAAGNRGSEKGEYDSAQPDRGSNGQANVPGSDDSRPKEAAGRPVKKHRGR